MPSKSHGKGTRDLPTDKRTDPADTSGPHGPGNEAVYHPKEREYGIDRGWREPGT